MRPTAKSLILDLLSTVGDGSMAVRALVAAGELFGIEDNAVRVALARMVAKGLVDAADDRASYRLGANASSVAAHVTSWRRIDGRVRPWTGGWVCVPTTALPTTDRSAQRRGQRALEFLGFRTLERGLGLRPDNLADGVAGVREQLYRLGLDPAVPVFGLHDLDEQRAERARALWLADRSREYTVIIKRLRASLVRLPRLDSQEAMVESFLLGGEAIRVIVLDPLLPEELAPTAERKTLIELMRDYDKAGRAAWAPFMKRFGAPHRRAPHDVHRSETAALAEASI